MKNKSNKFIIELMIGSILGLVLLMIVMFRFIGSYMDETKSTISSYNIEVNKEENSKKDPVEYSEEMTVLVRTIRDDNISGYNMQTTTDVSRRVTEGTKIDDGHDNPIPLSKIKPGDIVDIVYSQDEEKVLSISKSSNATIINRVSGAIVDKDNNKLSVGGASYNYTKDTLVLGDEGTKIPIDTLTPYDIVTIQSIQGNAYSIVREEEGGKIVFEDIPKVEGKCELDRTRVFNLADLNKAIGVIPGDHKIEIELQGYDNISDVITIGKGEVHTISLKDIKIANSVINPMVNNEDIDYTIEIDGKIYKKGEKIELQQGQYMVTARAEGYQKWAKEINSVKYDIYDLYIYFIKEIEENDNIIDSQNQQVGSQNDTSANKTESSKSESINDSQEVTLNTNPIGAKVYINGAYKGETPCTMTLENGSYGIIFEKDGYIPYSTNIMLDGSSDKPGYLYDMIKN